MFFASLFDYLPELAAEGTSSISVYPGNRYNIPPGDYAFFEMYCNEKDCDCRRVFLNVVSRAAEDVAAVISYGWESKEFYAKWYLGEQTDAAKLDDDDMRDVASMKGPCLVTSSQQSEYAPAIMQMTADLLLSEKSFVDKLKRHYKLFKAELDGKTLKEDEQTSSPLLAHGGSPVSGKRGSPPDTGKGDARSANIPKAMREIYEIVASIIKDFCKEYLDDEYAAMSLRLLEKLCRKRPSPLTTGKLNTWACGIVYVIGSNNFLFDKTQPYHMRALELAERFGLSGNTAGNKARDIRKMFRIKTFDTEWTLPSKLGSNPLVWLFETSSGFLMDARYASRDVQEKLFNAGLIPFIPDDRKAVEEQNTEEASAETEESQKSGRPEKKKQNTPLEGQTTFFEDSSE